MAEAEAPPVAPPVVPSRRIFYGWWIVFATAGLQFLQGSLLGQAYGAYVVVLASEFGWSKTLLSGASAMREMEGGILGPVQGWLIDRVGPRAVARAGVVTLAVGLFLFSRLNSPVTFYASFLVMAIGGSMIGFITTTTAVVNWFERRRSMALSLTSLGSALAGVLLPVTVVLSIEEFGWRTTAVLAGFAALLIGLPLTQILRTSPAEMGLRPDGAPPEVDAADGDAGVRLPSADFTLREAMRAPSFWWVSCGHGSALFVVGAVNVHLLQHITESLGYSLTQASGVFSLVTLMFMVGTLGGGYLGDRTSKRWLAFCCMGMHGTGLVLISHATGIVMLIAGAVIHGLAWGGRGPQMGALRADYFGRAAFGKIMGVSNMVTIIGAILGPLIAGVLYDVTGTYRLGFDVIAGLAVLGSIFFVLAVRPQPPVRPAPLEV